jgi:hypothetical protein
MTSNCHHVLELPSFDKLRMTGWSFDKLRSDGGWSFDKLRMTGWVVVRQAQDDGGWSFDKLRMTAGGPSTSSG